MEIERIGNWKGEEAPAATDSQTGISIEQVGKWAETPPTPEKPYAKPEIEKQLFSTGDLDMAAQVSGGDLEWAMRITHGLRPDDVARARKLAEGLKMPEGTAYRNLGTAEEMQRSQDVLKTLTQKKDDGTWKYPTALGWLASPEKMALAKDDVGALANIEKEIERTKKEDWGNVKKYGAAALSESLRFTSGLAALPAFAEGAIYAPQNYIADKFNLPSLKVSMSSALLPARKLNELAASFRPVQMDADLIDQIKKGEVLKAADNIALQVVANVPSLVAMAVTGGLYGEVAGLGLAAGSAAGTSYKEGVDIGKSPIMNVVGAVTVGGAEALFEKVTLGILSKAGEDLVKAVGKNQAKMTMGKVAANMFESYVAEGESEAATSIVQGLADYTTGNKEALSQIPKETLSSFLVGGAMGAGITGMSGGTRMALDRLNDAKDAKAVASTSKAAEASKLTERDRSQLEAFINKNIQDKQLPDTLYIPVEAVLSYAQTKDPEQAKLDLAELGITDTAVAEAEKTGADIEVNRAAFISKTVGTEIGKHFENEIRTSLDSPTGRERVAITEEARRVLSDLQDEYNQLQAEATPDKHLKVMRDAMVASGKFTAEEADAQAQVFDAGMRQLAFHAGMTTSEFYDTVNPTLAFEEAGPIMREFGRTEFRDGETRIVLTSSADMSTFLHEAAHVFTKQMETIVGAGKADLLASDLARLTDFAGGKLDREGYEKIARGFEAYLREGKAPSVEMANTFLRFKQWLTAIYRTLRGLNVELTDDVRRVFDRMLASEVESLDAERYFNEKRRLEDILRSEEKGGEKKAPDETLQKSFDKIADTRTKAERSSEERQLHKNTNAYYRAIGGKGTLLAKAKAEVEVRPEYREYNEIMAKGGLNRDSLREMYGEAILDKIDKAHPGLVVLSGGVTIPEMAIELESDGGDTGLIARILQAPPKRFAELVAYEQLVHDAEAAIREGATESIPGEESYHNEARLEYLIAQMQLLNEKIARQQGTKTRKIDAKAVTDAANEAISNKAVRHATRYDLYAKAEKRYMREALRLAAQGKLAEAALAMQKVILNHEMVRAAVKARESIAKIEKRYGNKKLGTTVKGLENDYANAAIAIARFYGLTDLASLPGPEVDISKLDPHLVSLIPSWILQRQMPVDGKSYKDLSYTQLQELDAALKSILHAGKQELMSLEIAGVKSVSDFANSSIAEMSHLETMSVPDEYSKKSKPISTFRALLSEVAMFEFIFERLDNYKFTKEGVFGPLRKLFNRGISAEAKYNDLKQRVFNQAKPHWEILNNARNRLDKVYGSKGYDIPGLPVPAQMVKLGRNTWNAKRLVSYVLNMGNKHNRDVLHKAFNFDESHDQIVLDLFTKEELAAIQGIWDATDTLFEPLDATHFRVYNRHIQKVPAQAVILKDGTQLRGGYYPLMFDHMLSDTVGQMKEDDILKNSQTTVFRTTKPEDGMTVSRTGQAHSLPPDLTTDVWFRHIADTARFISHAEYLRDFDRITKNKDFVAMFRDKAGREMYDELRKLVSFLARPERQLDTKWEKILEHMRTLATAQALGLGFTTGLKQRLSLLNTANEIGLRYLISGFFESSMATSIVGLRSAQWEEVLAKSEYLRTRERKIDRELADIVSKMDPLQKKFKIAGKEFTWKDVQDFIYEWINMNDRAIVLPAWLGGYRKRMAENAHLGSEEARDMDARQYADTIVRSTQASALPIELNSLQRSKGTMRLFTSFMTWSFKFLSRQLYYNKAYWSDNSISTRDYVRHIMYEIVLPSYGGIAMSTLVGELRWPDGEEVALSILDTLLSGIPFVREVTGALKYRKPVGATPAGEGILRAAKATNTAFDYFNGDAEFAKLLWDVSRAGDFWTGVPATKVVKSIYDTVQLIEGNKPEGRK